MRIGLFFILLSSVTKAIIEIRPIQTNGLLFEYKGTVFIVEEIWKVHSKMSIKQYLLEPINLENRIIELKVIQQMQNSTEVTQSLSMLMDEIQKLIFNINQLNTIIHDNSKQKRDAWVPIVGTAYQYLFRIPDEHTTNEIFHRLIELERADLSSKTMIANNTVLTLDIVENIQQKYNYTQNQVEILIKEIEEIMLQNLSNERDKQIIVNTQILILAITKYNNLQLKILDYLTCNKIKFLDPELFPFFAIEKTLKEVNDRLDMTRTLPRMNQLGKILWYKTIQMKINIHEGEIIFELSIPVISRNKKQLYAVHSTPILNNDSLIYIEPEAPFIVTNEIKNEIGFLSQTELSNCIAIEEEYYLCTNSFAIYNRHTNNNYCELISLLNAEEPIHNCVVKEIPKRNMIIKIPDTNQYYFIAVEPIAVIAQCGHNFTVQFNVQFNTNKPSYLNSNN